jgi:hypothetical protein
MEVLLKLIQPLIADSTAYQDATRRFFQGEMFKFSTIKSREDIAARLSAVTQLDSANRGLLNRINSFESDARKLLQSAGLNEVETEGFMQGLQDSLIKRVGAMRAVRGLEKTVYADLVTAFTLLDGQWGKWHVDEQRKVVFDDEQVDEKFRALLKEVAVLMKRVTIANHTLLNTP